MEEKSSPIERPTFIPVSCDSCQQKKKLNELDSPVVVWSRPSSLRSRRGSRVLNGQLVYREPDTLCVLPFSMRLLCALLTFLLITSLAAAIFNSLQGNARGSTSYCKMPDQPFTSDVLCPRETMFFYYQCCDISPILTNKCCATIRVWLLFAIICVGLSCVLCAIFTILKYCCRCIRRQKVPFITQL